MANPERNIGQDVRDVGIVIAILGLLPVLRGLLLPGVGMAVGGEIYNRSKKK